MSFSLKQFTEQAKKAQKSSEYIEATSKYASRLILNEYPVIFSVEHLAMLMGIQSGYIRRLIADGKNFENKEPYKVFRYNYFKIKKRTGGYREIMAPSKDLKYIQKWILLNILEKYNLHHCCKGFRKNISIYDNAKPHEGADLILKVDLLRFYDTISENQIFRVFADMGYAKNLAVSLAKLTTAEHRWKYWNSIEKNDLKLMGFPERYNPAVLPQGAPTSPMLANIRANVMDKRFYGLSKKLNFNYTRYADDLTFSIKNKGTLPNLNLIRKIVLDEGFVVNEGKVTYMRKGGKQYVTGLTTANGVNVSKKYRKNIATHIHFCRKLGVLEHLKNTSMKSEKVTGIMTYHDWLYGHICFIQSINKEAGKKLLADFSKIDWI